MKKVLTAAMATMALASCGEAAEDAATATGNGLANELAAQSNTIVDIATSDGQFSTLGSAVSAASLGQTLAGEGPYTVFAPTNRAFAKIDQNTLNGLMQAEARADLRRILTYHVVPGEILAADLIGQIEADDEGIVEMSTANGASLTVSLADGNLVLTDATGGTATLVTTDVNASNGVIHIIDTVLMPGNPAAVSPSPEEIASPVD